jgi:TPR repeat protein
MQSVAYGIYAGTMSSDWNRVVDPDPSKAAPWLIRAAKQGHGYAQVNLGDAYYSGSGVREDWSEAAEWYRAAADQGLYCAQLRLAEMLVKGEGVQRDLIEAHKWFNLAATLGRADGPGGTCGPTAASKRDDLTKELTRDQLTEAHRRARDWKPKISPDPRLPVSGASH